MNEASALRGRTAVVTGGARGIGRAVCELLAERGGRLPHRHPGQQRGVFVAGEGGYPTGTCLDINGGLFM